MKLVDEKGKLFGVVNLIDFFVILFLLAIIPGLYFGYKIMFQKPKPPFGSDIKEIVLNCQLIRLKPDVAELISVDDTEVDDIGRVIGEIISLGKSEPYKEDSALKQRDARLKIKARFKESDLCYKDRIIDYDTELVFKTNKYNAIVKVKEDITKRLNIRIVLKELEPELLNLIAVGDREIDEDGQIVAEVIKISEPEDSILELDLTGSNFTLGRESERKQISVEMLLKCQIIKEGTVNQIYFKGGRITYNSPIKFAMDKYELLGFMPKMYIIAEEGKIKRLFEY